MIAVLTVPLYAEKYYVSPSGSNANGTSWATAWSELGNINWNVLQPGDTIYLDGGATQMEYYPSYENQFVIGKSGAQGSPISIKLSDEPGRNGKVIIYGDRPIPLPYIYQPEGSYGYTRPRPTWNKLWGINLSGNSWIVIDGRKWSGITIARTDGGIDVWSDNVLVRNVEIYDTGFPIEDKDGHVGTVSPSSDPGAVGICGTNLTFERMIIHDNGEDAFRPGPVYNFKIKQSRMYIARMMPDGSNTFNYVNHCDGIQLYAGGENGPVLMEDCIFGPGLMQGLQLGGGQGMATHADNVTISNTLFFRNLHNIAAVDGTNPAGWNIENVTSVNSPGHCMILDGTGHVVKDSVLWKGDFYCSDQQPAVSGNYYNSVATVRTIGTQVSDLMFVNAGADDYALQQASPAYGKGSRVTSVARFFELFSNEGSDSAGVIQLSASSYSIWEASGNAVITVTRLGGSSGAVGIQYTTGNGTAQAGSDYTAKSGTLNWTDGESAGKTFTIAIINDSNIENSETVSLTLSNATGGAVLGSPGTAALTIVNDDVVSTDSSAPSRISAVRDGTGTDIDSISPGTELSANWNESTDSESGIKKYWYAIGTTAGATNVLGWTDNGVATSVTRTGLSLTAGTTYYFTVKAENGVSLQGTTANSDGQCYINTTGGRNELPKEKIIVKHQNLLRLSDFSNVRFQVTGTEGGSELRIYTLTGKLVRALTIGSGVGETNWDLLNEQGENIKPGIYLYTIADSFGNKKTGKLVISR